MRFVLTTSICLLFNLKSYTNSTTRVSFIGEPPATVSMVEDENAIPELNLENVKQAIIDAGIKNPDVVLRQAILETGWLKCTNCSLGTNNLFGFFYKGKYLSFENWVESVEYYKWWQDQLYTGGDYYEFLRRVGYATAPNYIRELKNLKGLY